MPHAIGTHYYLLHLLGILLVFSGYGVLIARGLLGSDSRALRKFGAMTSGIGALAILIGGFGLIAKLPYADYTLPWVLIKFAVWLALGAMLAVINRKPQLGQVWFWTILVLGLIAVWAAYYKPGGLAS